MKTTACWLCACVSGLPIMYFRFGYCTTASQFAFLLRILHHRFGFCVSASDLVLPLRILRFCFGSGITTSDFTFPLRIWYYHIVFYISTSDLVLPLWYFHTRSGFLVRVRVALLGHHKLPFGKRARGVPHGLGAPLNTVSPLCYNCDVSKLIMAAVRSQGAI